jgi:hypothetical protein
MHWSRVQREIEFRERYAQDQVSFPESAPASLFMTICQMRLREIGKAEEVLRASFRELNSNMNSWNREFFEGLRFVVPFVWSRSRDMMSLQLPAASAARSERRHLLYGIIN